MGFLQFFFSRQNNLCGKKPKSLTRGFTNLLFYMWLFHWKLIVVMMIIFLSLQAILEDEVKETKTAQDTLSNFQKVKVMYKFQTNFIYSGLFSQF